MGKKHELPPEFTSAYINHWSPATVGAVIGGAFGFTLFSFLSLGFLWVGLLISFSPIVSVFPVIFVFALAAGIGAIIGRSLAKASSLPPVHPLPVIVLAFFIPFAPIAIGFVEVALADELVAIPASAQNVRSRISPAGGQVINFESSETVEVLHEQLVNSAKDAGWRCNNCEYQPSTGGSYIKFEPWFPKASGLRGELGFEILEAGKPYPQISGELKAYDLAQVSIWHNYRPSSISWTILAEAALLFATIFYPWGRRPSN